MQTLALKKRCKGIAIFTIFCLMLELLIFGDRTGFAVENERSEKDILLTCGTEKGKHKCKNHRTAGTWRKHLDRWSYTTLE